MPEYQIKFDKTFAYEVESIFKQNNARYGYPRIQIVLENKGIKVSCSKVYRYMKLLNLYSNLRIKKFIKKPKENKKHESKI
ncbi:IS3 family transposase [Mesoplasma tabanidae]|uniref:IS3 family transposase n=1 Tax=Mesoplasma tabanidae TaxID=219745 RepID=UPI000C291ACE|nr:IS3 family transposase [Mesoplasma tabanidae]